MVLVDTSVWINHLHTKDSDLETLLLETEVVCHPFIIGELACGGIRNRKEILSLLSDLPASPVITQEEHLHFVESNRLMGKGIGFVDTHLLASARLSRVSLWTAEKNLIQIARDLKLSYI
ncbi:VapC toxin family PIN domain ribonuclease [bacterium E08(2017)]|nr:VapC toxin family PIN domain ribonuclease [bacterium E08(2017)]